MTTEIWIVVYAFFNGFLAGTRPSLRQLAEQMCFLRPIGMMNMWYMPMILGIYLAIPFVSLALSHVRARDCAPAMAVVAIAALLLPTINAVLQGEGSELRYSLRLDLSYIGGLYGLYVVSGYFLFHRRLAWRLSRGRWALIAIIAIAILLLADYASTAGWGAWVPWYDYLPIFCASLPIFALFITVETPRPRRIVTFLSRYAFAIFLVHPLWIRLATTYFAQVLDPLPLLGQAALLFAGALGLSALLAALICRSHHLGLLLFDKRH